MLFVPLELYRNFKSLLLTSSVFVLFALFVALSSAKMCCFFLFMKFSHFIFDLIIFNRKISSK